ncbi:MAG: transposase [Trichodesmium sp. St16_bin4-tuft]|nr:transposase [Trichodesmium sp. St5_bin8]MDE5077310.1 transposase [Trichodesmium sp. St2_bin6]MDE5099464.1 transposase [Trichodesmium sp. St16_bin4-tuft]MDE5101740.1 transposase [Trichodesmium sp. St19_bin2]
MSKKFRKWHEYGVWEKINHTLRRETRVQEARHQEFTVAIVDFHRVKTIAKRRQYMA